jgi:hypothetical protein
MEAGAEGRGGYAHVSVCLMDMKVDQAFMIFHCFHLVFACSGPQHTQLEVTSLNTRGLRKGAVET